MVSIAAQLLSNQFSSFRPLMCLKYLVLSVTNVRSLASAVTSIIKSNSSCSGVPFFLKETSVSAYSFTMPKIEITVNPFTNLSTASCDFFGLSLFCAPYLSSNTVSYDIKQLSSPFSLMISSNLRWPRRKNTQILVSSKYHIG